MINENEAPERIWIDWEGPHEADHSLQLECYSFDCKSQHEYIHADLSDAKDKRIAELEAKLAKAVDALGPTIRALGELTEGEWLGDFNQKSIAATLHNARATHAELKGTD